MNTNTKKDMESLNVLAKKTKSSQPMSEEGNNVELRQWTYDDIPYWVLTALCVKSAGIISLAFTLMQMTILDTMVYYSEDGQIIGMIKLTTFWTYWFVLACNVIGLAFSLLLCFILMNDPLQLDHSSKSDLYNEVMLIILASGGATCFWVTMELSRFSSEVFIGKSSHSKFDSIQMYITYYVIGFVSNYVSVIMLRASPARAIVRK